MSTHVGNDDDRRQLEEAVELVVPDAAHLYGGLLAVLTSYCEARGIPHHGVPVGTLKRHATGRGNADKAAMVAAARERWRGQNVEGDAQAGVLVS